MNYPLIGAFVIVLGLMLIAGALWLASGGAWKKKYDSYLAIENESVAGLNLNAPVKYNGVVVGKVDEIQLDTLDPERVHLSLAIERGTPIKQDTVAVLRSQGLTGIAYVELSGGTRDSPPLQTIAGEQYPVIHTMPSLSARLENVLTTALEKLDHLSTNIDALLSDKNQVAFSHTLADIATVTHMFATRSGTLDAGILSAAQTFNNTARVTAQLDPVVTEVNRSAKALEKMGNATTEASTSAIKAFNSVDINVQQFSVETLPNFQHLLGELDALSSSLRRLSEQTERNPAGLLLERSPVPDGPGEFSTERPVP